MRAYVSFRLGANVQAVLHVCVNVLVSLCELVLCHGSVEV